MIATGELDSRSVLWAVTYLGVLKSVLPVCRADMGLVVWSGLFFFAAFKRRKWNWYFGSSIVDGFIEYKVQKYTCVQYV